MIKLACWWAAAILCVVGICPTATAGEAPPILSENSVWRVCFKMDTPVMRVDGDLKPAPSIAPWQYHCNDCTSPAVPSGWTAADYDDSEWPGWRPAADAQRGSEGGAFKYGFSGAGASNPGVSAICLRGRFTVADPAQATDLKLSLAYRGGAVVHLNGKEIARGHLPKDAVLAPDAVADDYPTEVFLKENKQPIREDFGEPGKYRDQLEKRIRTLEIAIDAQLLRPGVNVLAIELRRAPYIKGIVDKHNSNYRCAWGTCGLNSLALRGTRGLNAGPAGPQGVRIRNQPAGQWVDAGWQGEDSQAVGPIRLAGARNGAFSGQVVVSSSGELKAVKASASDLKAADGQATIPASAVQVRYTIPPGSPSSMFDGLEDTPPADAVANRPGMTAVQPVWVTVQVPRDIKPGQYSGKLVVEANGRKAAEVPVELSVADWTIPDSKAFTGFIDIVDSPRTLALKYQVPMWSEEHWKLLDRNFALMGQLGAKCLYLVLLPETYFGNEHSMVYWIRQPDGSYKHDFSLVDKYLDAAMKHLGKPEVVVVDIWDRRFGVVNYTGNPAEGSAQTKGTAFTVLDPATGKLSVGEAPLWGTPEARDFWKPVLEGIKERLTKRGIGKSLMWGLASDRRPRKETVEDLKALAPEVPWVCHSHPKTEQIHGRPVGYMVHVWGAPQINRKTVTGRLRGWESSRIITTFPRLSSGGVGAIYNGTSPLKYRCGIEGMMICGYRGLGRVGGEFWEVLPGRKGQEASVLRTTPDVGETWGIGFDAAISQLFAPGRNGPIATVRSEMFRENQQEIEARVLLEKALADPAKKAKLGEALATRCQTILDERGQAIVAGGLSPNWLYFQQGLLDRTGKLYAAAAEAAGRFGKQ